MGHNRIGLMVTVLLIVSFVYAVDQVINTFSDGSSTSSFSLDINETQSTTVLIPRYGLVNESVVNLTSYRNISQWKLGEYFCGNYGREGGTISFWINHEMEGPLNYTFDLGRTGITSCRTEKTGTNFTCETYKTGGGPGIPIKVNYVNLNRSKWFHVAYVYNNLSGYYLYVNGSLVSSNLQSGVLCRTAFSPYNRLGGTASASITNKYKGYLADFRAYDKALVASQIHEIYNTGDTNETPFSDWKFEGMYGPYEGAGDRYTYDSENQYGLYSASDTPKLNHTVYPSYNTSGNSSVSIYLQDQYMEFLNNSLRGVSLDIGLDGNNELYRYIFDGNENVANLTSMQLLTNNTCNCTGCSINGYNCEINYSIRVESGGDINLTALNIVSVYGIDNCTNSYGISSNSTASNVSVYDEDDVLTSVQYDSTVEYIGDNFSHSIPSTNHQRYCVYPAWFNQSIEHQFEYTYESVVYNYFLDTDYNNDTKTVNLYIQNGTTQVLFTVLDRGNPVESAFIHVLKYDVGTGTYSTTEILKTDSQGQAIGNIILGTAFYNFLIYYEGSLVYTEIGVKLISTTRTFNINLLGDYWLDDFSNIFDVNTQLYYNNATQNFVFVWSDPGGEVHYGCLRVVYFNDTGKYIPFDNCTQSASGTIIYNINPQNGTEYIATGYFRYDNEIIAERLAISFEALRDFFTERPLPSLFIAYMLTLVLFLIGIPQPIIAESLLGLGIIISFMLGMLSVTLLQIGAVVILIIIQFYLAGRQKE